MNTRDIAVKLFRYAALVKAEADRRRAIDEITGQDYSSSLETEVETVQSMANELWEMKENL